MQENVDYLITKNKKDYQKMLVTAKERNLKILFLNNENVGDILKELLEYLTRDKLAKV